MKGTLLRRSAIYQPTWMVLSWLTCGEGGLVPRDGEAALARHPTSPSLGQCPVPALLLSPPRVFFFFNLSTLFKILFIYFTLNYFIGFALHWLESKGLLRQILDKSGGPTERTHRRGVGFCSLLFPKISFLYVGLFQRRIKQAFIFAGRFTFSKRISSLV